MYRPAGSFLHARCRWPARSRIVAGVLSALMLLAMLATIIGMGLLPGGGGRREASLAAFDVRGDRQAERRREPRRAEHRAEAKRRASAPADQPRPTPTTAAVLPPGFLNLSREQYAATDISGLPHHAAEAAAPEGDAGKSAMGPGEGPGGVRLYNAEWVREPSRAELAPYFTGSAPVGAWATIACRTIERFHVEDCQELDESPLGSGLARALRRASWQFLVRPPRAEGKLLVGSWVRIRFDFLHGGGEEMR